MQHEYEIKSLQVYGDYAKGVDKPGSELCIMVEFGRAPSLFKVVRLQRRLGELVGVKVHLTDKNGLEEKYRQLVLDEGVAV